MVETGWVLRKVIHVHLQRKLSGSSFFMLLFSFFQHRTELKQRKRNFFTAHIVTQMSEVI